VMRLFVVILLLVLAVSANAQSIVSLIGQSETQACTTGNYFLIQNGSSPVCATINTPISSVQSVFTQSIPVYSGTSCSGPVVYASTLLGVITDSGLNLGNATFHNYFTTIFSVTYISNDDTVTAMLNSKCACGGTWSTGKPRTVTVTNNCCQTISSPEFFTGWLSGETFTTTFSSSSPNLGWYSAGSTFTETFSSDSCKDYINVAATWTN